MAVRVSARESAPGTPALKSRTTRKWSHPCLGSTWKGMRAALNRMSDCDLRLRERWVAEWASSLPRSDVVLDAGSGDAHLAKLFPAQEYIGIDIQPKPGSCRSVCCGDLHRLPIRDCSVDHVVSVQVLEHVMIPEEVVREFVRVVKPGGSVCLSVPQADPEHETPFDFYRFTSYSLRLIAASVGLEVRSIRRKGGYFRRLSSQLRDLPFVLFPRREEGKLPSLATLLCRAVLVITVTFCLAPLLVLFDHLDEGQEYTTGYFCIFDKPLGSTHPLTRAL